MDDPSDSDSRRARALARYKIISAYVALDPARGQKRKLLDQLASRIWTDAGGEPLQVAAETLRTWVRRYRSDGLAGLEDKPRAKRGVQLLSSDEVALVCQLKRDVPERSLDRLIKIAEDAGRVEPGRLRRSTVHRVLRSEGLSARKPGSASVEDLDRFEADAPNDLWQSDLLHGPWLSDPERPGRMRRAKLYAFIDDHSRLLLHGRFSFDEDLPHLELVFRRCLQKYGQPRRCYYDNGKVYRSGHMQQIVATLGIHPLIFTTRHRPEGHGKIEALNRFIRSAFLAELKSSRITTLDALNEAFLAWMDVEYNRRPHGETGELPRDRWQRAIDRVRFCDEEKLRLAFLWREYRSPDKAGVFSLFGQRYQTTIGKRRIEVRFDPESLLEIEVHLAGRFVERVRPFEVHTHRRSKPEPATQPAPSTTPPAPTVDWLAHLQDERRRLAFVEPAPHALAAERATLRRASDDTVVDRLRQRLDAASFDEAVVRDHLARFGPFDADVVEQIVEQLLEHGARPDQHVSFFLDHVRQHHQRGDQP
jgi:transposase InsO family protein